MLRPINWANCTLTTRLRHHNYTAAAVQQHLDDCNIPKQQFRQAQSLMKAATVCQFFYFYKLRVFTNYDNPSILATISNRKACW